MAVMISMKHIKVVMMYGDFNDDDDNDETVITLIT